ncbi:hypothetical protein QBC44DRAFT_389781 [Cladorrhinum sp. PSN332]|nr:hypothetical protein QBC44DRAFT_389781 [Cladorrhinum sp. PSN332]
MAPLAVSTSGYPIATFFFTLFNFIWHLIWTFIYYTEPRHAARSASGYQICLIDPGTPQRTLDTPQPPLRNHATPFKIPPQQPRGRPRESY